VINPNKSIPCASKCIKLKKTCCYSCPYFEYSVTNKRYLCAVSNSHNNWGCGMASEIKQIVENKIKTNQQKIVLITSILKNGNCNLIKNVLGNNANKELIIAISI